MDARPRFTDATAENWQLGEDHAGVTSRPPHMVQFYEKEDFLFDAVATFLADGLIAGEPALVIATSPHWLGVEERLRVMGIDLSLPLSTGQLAVFDARDTLAKFMDGPRPDEHAFRIAVGGLLERSMFSGRREICVRTYGEMVDLLVQDGNPEGAIRVEELWNNIACTHPLSLMCAYAMRNFDRIEYAPHFQDVCRAHAHVIPAESYSQADEQARALEVSRLQQRARALETEIGYRKELEQALREALAQRRKAEAECERLLAAETAARAAAEEASRLKDEFLAVLSHELRTPLSAILGWAHIVNDLRPEPATIERALQVIQRNAELQLRLIDDLLDVSRIVTGKLHVSAHAVDLSAILSAARDGVRPAASGKGIQLHTHADDTACFVTGDPGRLQQVVWNLLSNAIKFTPAGGRVELLLHRRDGQAQIVVRDNGQGIEPDFLPHVFERFRQADTTTTRRHGGLGVGLAVVCHLVEAHGGTVSAESPGVGLGSTFSVTLPLRAGDTDAVAPTT